MIENIGAYSQVDYDRGYQQGRSDANDAFVNGIKEILEDNAIYNIDCIVTLAEQLKEQKNE